MNNKPWKFWLALALAMAVMWYWLVGCLAHDMLGWACLPAIGKATGVAAFFLTLVTGGMCCSSATNDIRNESGYNTTDWSRKNE